MANSKLFSNKRRKSTVGVPKTNTVNNAGGNAYALKDKHALAQLAVTGMFGDSYYVSAQTQLDQMIELAYKVPTEYLGQLAIYARFNGFMKDSPALLCAVLADRDVPTLKKVFSTVIDNGRMLRNFCQIIRSGQIGRTSFGTAVKKMIQRWLDNRTAEQIFKDSVGNDPSLADVIKMVHPKANTVTRSNLYAYVIGKVKVEYARSLKAYKQVGRSEWQKIPLKNLPSIVKEYETYKLTGKGNVPKVPFQMLTALSLGTSEWTEIARNAQWTMTRMNLNTFERHGVFNDNKMVNLIADRLSDPDEVRRARAFPYQLFAAYKNANGDVPAKVRDALHDAMETATENVPEIDGKVYICVDVSGSMGCSVSGYRDGGVTSKINCLDVAALYASSILRKNSDAEVILFDTTARSIKLSARDTVLTNAAKISNRLGGGTDCGCAIEYLNKNSKKGDLVVMISDNESWAGFHCGGRGWGGYTDMAVEWKKFKKNNADAKLVNIDIAPNRSVQVKSDKDVLNVGGFSDTVFNIVSSFANDELSGKAFVKLIKSINLDGDISRKTMMK